MPSADALTVEVELPSGTMSLSHAWTPPTQGTVVVLAHGAGAGMDHPFLVGLADALHAHGLGTLRFSFPYRESGRRLPGPAAHAIAAWRAAVAAVRTAAPESTIVAAGKSYGGRMASMAVAEGLEVDALVYLGYPLHPPGAPEKLRADHLPAIREPQLFIEGTKDPFIQPLDQFAEVIATCQRAEVAWVDGGGHSFDVAGEKRSADEAGAALAPFVADFAAAL